MSGDRRRSSPRAKPSVPGLDPRIYDALSYLHAYALALDAERQRSAVRLEAHRLGGAGPSECSEPEQRHRQLNEELDALRTVIEKLREYADPDGRYL